MQAQTVSCGIGIIVDDNLRQYRSQDALLQLYRCVRMIPQPRQIFAQCRQLFLLLFTKGSRNNNLDKAGGGEILSTRFESIVPIRVSLVAADAEFFHLGLRHLDTRFVLIGIENCLDL